jgi:hypothetical protein
MRSTCGADFGLARGELHLDWMMKFHFLSAWNSNSFKTRVFHQDGPKLYDFWNFFGKLIVGEPCERKKAAAVGVP